MIESSFAKQYGIRLSLEDISVGEYYRLLSGLMDDTPLGAVIRIRSEDDPKVLKEFGPEQRKIRSDWRLFINQKRRMTMTKAESRRQIQELKNIFMHFAVDSTKERR